MHGARSCTRPVFCRQVLSGESGRLHRLFHWLIIRSLCLWHIWLIHVLFQDRRVPALQAPPRLRLVSQGHSVLETQQTAQPALVVDQVHSPAIAI